MPMSALLCTEGMVERKVWTKQNDQDRGKGGVEQWREKCKRGNGGSRAQIAVKSHGRKQKERKPKRGVSTFLANTCRQFMRNWMEMESNIRKIMSRTRNKMDGNHRDEGPLRGLGTEPQVLCMKEACQGSANGAPSRLHGQSL